MTTLTLKVCGVTMDSATQMGVEGGSLPVRARFRSESRIYMAKEKRHENLDCI